MRGVCVFVNLKDRNISVHTCCSLALFLEVRKCFKGGSCPKVPAWISLLYTLCIDYVTLRIKSPVTYTHINKCLTSIFGNTVSTLFINMYTHVYDISYSIICIFFGISRPEWCRYSIRYKISDLSWGKCSFQGDTNLNSSEEVLDRRRMLAMVSGGTTLSELLVSSQLFGTWHRG